MNHVLRAFIAVPISAPAKLRAVAAELSQMGRAVKAVDPDALHVTLKFLGDVEFNRVPEFAAVVTKCVAGTAPCTSRLAGLGVFPHRRRPSVVWAGLQDAEPLIAIARQLEDCFEPLGFAPERRGFTPHVTLARIRSRPPRELDELLDRDAAASFGPVEVDSVVLFQSELGTSGPKYTPLHTAPLGEQRTA